MTKENLRQEWALQVPHYNGHDPRPGAESRADAYYAFAQQKGETLEECAVRAAQKIIDTGLNRYVGGHLGTNHVAANNAAFAFSEDVLAELEENDDPLIGCAQHIVELWKVRDEHEKGNDWWNFYTGELMQAKGSFLAVRAKREALERQTRDARQLQALGKSGPSVK